MEDSKIYVSCSEYSRLCRVDGMMDALISYIDYREQENQKLTPEYPLSLDAEAVKAIIGMCDQ